QKTKVHPCRWVICPKRRQTNPVLYNNKVSDCPTGDQYQQRQSRGCCCCCNCGGSLLQKPNSQKGKKSHVSSNVQFLQTNLPH
ncbi:unnamed protein product, partial [Linum tenue]